MKTNKETQRNELVLKYDTVEVMGYTETLAFYYNSFFLVQICAINKASPSASQDLTGREPSASLAQFRFLRAAYPTDGLIARTLVGRLTASSGITAEGSRHDAR